MDSPYFSKCGQSIKGSGVILAFERPKGGENMFAKLIQHGIDSGISPLGYCGTGAWPHTPCSVGLNPHDGICKAGGCSIEV